MNRHHKGLSFYKKKKKISISLIKEVLNWLFGILISIFIAVMVTYAFGMSVGMIGVSMEPMIHNGQNVLINRYAYLILSPQRDDVIAFLPNGNANSHYYLKRVIAKPGDTVQIIDGRLYVNDKRIEDNFDKMEDAGIAQNPIILGNNEYFVLGDNRNNSEDSRSANIGMINSSDIVGKVWFKLSQDSNKMGFVK